MFPDLPSPTPAPIVPAAGQDTLGQELRCSVRKLTFYWASKPE